MKKLITLILFIILTMNSNAQNLINNGSFEQYDTIPYSSGQIKFAHSWNGIGSVDYFHEYSTIISGVNIPYTFPGILPRTIDGLGCCGECVYIENQDNYREYLLKKLDTSLIIGNSYTLKINVLTTLPNPIYGGWTADNFGILLSKSKPQKAISHVIEWQPQYVYPTQLFASNWKELNFTFIADSAYKYITIGCFVNDSIQQRHHVDSTSWFDAVYLYIDNVSLYNNSITGVPIRDIPLNKVPKIKYDLLGNMINTEEYYINKEQIKIK